MLRKGTKEDDDEYFEWSTLGVKEFQASLKGRYSSVPAATIDLVSTRMFLRLSHLTLVIDLEILLSKSRAR